MKKKFPSLMLGVATYAAVHCYPLYAEEEPPVETQLETLRQLDLSSPRQTRQFRGIVYTLAESGQGGATILQLTEEVENEKFRRQTLRNVVRDIADHEPAALLEWIQEDNDRIKLYLNEDAALPLAVAYPLEMIELAKKLCPLDPRPEPTPEVDARLHEFKKFRDEALCWFEKSVVQGAFTALSKEDREGALEAAELWDGHEFYYPMALEYIISAWAVEDLEGAKRFAQSANHDPELSRKLRGAISESVGKDVFRENEPDVGDAERTWQDIEERINSEAPLAVANWIETSVTDPEQQLNGYQSLIARWVRNDDPVAAVEWVDSRPAGPVRDRLIQSVLRGSNTRKMADGEIREVLELAASIGEPDSIRAPLRSLLRGWFRHSRENAAQEYVETSPILEERDKEDLRRYFKAIEELPDRNAKPLTIRPEELPGADDQQSKWRNDLKAKSGISPDGYDAFVYINQSERRSEGVAKAIVKTWFLNSDDPKEIASWFKSQELDSGLVEVLQSFTMDWFRFDEEGVAQWAAMQEEGELKTSMSIVIEAASNRNGRLLHEILNKNE